MAAAPMQQGAAYEPSQSIMPGDVSFAVDQSVVKV